jgi:putative transposase
VSRIARAVIEGVAHHITQRGNGQQVVFDSDEGRRVYLRLLRQNADQCELSLWGYCLMSNHVHLVAVPRREGSLAKALGRTHAQYAQYLNACRCSSGHVWQARFFSCPLGEDHLWRAMAYVECNPVRAGLCRRAADYPWSSAQARLRNDSLDNLLDLRAWRERYDEAVWEEILGRPNQDEAFQIRLREATRHGGPYCDPAKLEIFEEKLGRVLRPGRKGRPRGEKREQLQAVLAEQTKIECTVPPFR